jgi:hypothetical protein
VNAFNLKVRKALIREGLGMVNYAQRADGTTFFRLVFPNHQTQAEHLPQLFELILRVAQSVELSKES